MNKKISSLLAELDLTRSKFWNISKETGLFLNTLIRTTPSIKTILEIGTSNGVSAIYMAEALQAKAETESRGYPGTAHCSRLRKCSPGIAPGQNKKFHLYTIESHKKLRFPLATANFKKANLTAHITQILGHAPEIIPPQPKTFDLIFLDATKYEHADYLKAILPRTHKDSIIITDNAISHQEALKPYATQIFKHKEFETHLLALGSGLLVSTKLKS